MIKNFRDFCDTPFDIVVLAGQSNAQGGGLGKVDNHYQRDERVCFLSDTKTFGLTVDPETDNVFLTADCPSITNISVAEDNEGAANLAFSFAREYAKNNLAEGRRLLVIRAAVGGTGFTRGEWLVTNKLFFRMLSMVDEALQLHKENRLVAFLWHQGEHDAFERAEKNYPAEEIENFYYENFKLLITSFRARYELEALPVIAGGFVDEWRVTYEQPCDAVYNATKRVFAEIGNAEFVETYGLKSNNQTVGNGDNIHFSREAIYTLGEKYYEKFMEIVK
ncbi:MAG: hypothetical protein IJB34_03740 [Clostridia bacterium]|nr:hypothetical protein [Clostridia bacterium]